MTNPTSSTNNVADAIVVIEIPHTAPASIHLFPCRAEYVSDRDAIVSGDPSLDAWCADQDIDSANLTEDEVEEFLGRDLHDRHVFGLPELPNMLKRFQRGTQALHRQLRVRTLLEDIAEITSGISAV